MVASVLRWGVSTGVGRPVGFVSALAEPAWVAKKGLQATATAEIAAVEVAHAPSGRALRPRR